VNSHIRNVSTENIIKSNRKEKPPKEEFQKYVNNTTNFHS